MALVTRNFTLNVTPGAMPPTVHVSEYDVGRTYTITLLGENGSAFEIPTDTAATVEGTLNGSVGFTQSATISNNQVSFTLSQSMTAYSGKAWCKIKLTLNNQPIQTCAFMLAVDRAGVEADTVIGAPGFEEQIQNAVNNYMDAAYQPDLPEGYIYVQEIPENADTSKIYVLPDGYAYEYSEHTVIDKHNANTGLVNIKPDVNANYQSLSAQSGVLTSDLIPFSADWVPSSADRANSTIKVSGIAKLVPAYNNSSIIVYYYKSDGTWIAALRTSQITSLNGAALGSEISLPVEWYIKDSSYGSSTWDQVGYVRVLLGISTSGDITSDDVENVVINVPYYDTERTVTGWARNGERFEISFSDAVEQNTRDIESLDVRVSALEESGGGGSGGGEETTVQTNQILYAVGDSITYGYGVGGNSGSWVRHVIDRNGYDAANSRNLGESGLGFCTASTSNHTVQDIVGGNSFAGADVVTVALGINDWKNYNVFLTDVWSGMEYVFGKIRSDNPYCKIYFIVPFNVSIGTSAYATFYGLGYAGDNNSLRPYAHTLLEFIGMLKERFALSPLNAYNVQIIDLTEGVAINRQNITTALIDNLHPTAETHIELGKEIAPILRFNNNYGQTAAQVQSAIGAIQAWQGGSY